MVVLPLLQYDDFDVLIERSGDAFEARVVNSPTGGTPAVSFVPPMSDEKLENLVLKMRTAHGVRGLETDMVPDTRQFGSALFDALFHDELLDRLKRSLTRTGDRRRGLRIRLRFSDAHELWNIPWEFLYDKESHRFLCQFDTTPVVRYVDIAQPVEPLTVKGPIRMLVMISSPSDYAPLDVEKEWQQLSEALEPLQATGSLTVQRLSTASLDELRHTVMFGEFHVFHYIGHGGLDNQTGDGLLVLTGSDGRGQQVNGADLFVMLARSPIRLAVLNSCLGSRTSAIDPYAGTAATLVHQGIPAVVAMQFEISDHAAIAFSRTLYEAIAYGWPVDMAVGEARRAILATSRSEWATPVLYLRALDGKLLEVTTPDRTPAPAPPTGLDGSLADHVVTLTWANVAAGLTPVSRWQVHRDGTQVSDVAEPRASDELPGPGSYVYTVVAVGIDGQRSVESAPWTVVVAPRPPAAPTGLSGSVSDAVVALHWAAVPAGLTPVFRWEIRRDGARVDDVTEPQARDEPPGPGTYSYTVVAVGADGQRSVESAGWTASVPVEPPPSPPQPLAAPTGLSGSSAANRVDLHWDPADPGSSAVARWEILRDGAPIAEATSPSARDVPPGSGSYRYTVLAVGEDGQRSTESAFWTAEVGPGRRPWWLVPALAILATVLAAAGLFLWAPWEPGGPETPAGLTGTVSGTEISLSWEPAPSGSAAVADWEVRRDGEVVGGTTVPRFDDTVPGPGTYVYTVVAVGEDGERSAESDSTDVTVPPADDPQPPTLEWQSLDAGFQGPFTAAGVAYYQGELWVVGGAAPDDQPLDQVRVLNPETGDWRDGPRLPIGIQHAPLVSNGEQLFLLGGLTRPDRDCCLVSPTVYRLDSPDGEWAEDDVPLPEPRFAGAAAWDGERLVFTGGASQLRPTRAAAADIWALESGEWVPVEGELQEPREHLAAVTDEEGTIWFVGGADVSRGRDAVFPDVDMVSGDSVDAGPRIGTAVQGAAAIWMTDTGICTFGGSTTLPNAGAGSMPVDEVDCLGGSEPATEWPDLPEPRAGAVAAIVDDTVYVVGGYGEGGGPLEAADMVLALRLG